jgi:hypothetical protein
MIESFRLGVQQISRRASDAIQAVDRTDRDLSPRTVLIILVTILAVMTFVPGILGYLDSVAIRALASLLIAVFAFFFVTVSSRIVGRSYVESDVRNDHRHPAWNQSGVPGIWVDRYGGQSDGPDGRDRGGDRRFDRG